MFFRVIFTLGLTLLAGCTSFKKPPIDRVELHCSREMGADYREFKINLVVKQKVNPNGSYPSTGEVRSYWRNNPIAGEFVDKAVGYVFFLGSGWLFRIKSESAGAYFQQLDVWTGKNYLVRSRFNKRPLQFRSLKCKKLASH